MLKTFETSTPGNHKILPLQAGHGLMLQHVTIDIIRSGNRYDAVYIYLCDISGEIPVFRISAKEDSKFVSTPVLIEGWQDAWVEVRVLGFGDTFVGITYESRNQPKKVDILVRDTVQYKYITKSKSIEGGSISGY